MKQVKVYLKESYKPWMFLFTLIGAVGAYWGDKL